MSTPHPCIGFFPALRLANTLDFGEWRVGTPTPETPWRSDRFRGLVTRLLSSLESEGFENGALLWHRDRGFDGTPPAPEQIKAIRAAVAFAVLDANDQMARDAWSGLLWSPTERTTLQRPYKTRGKVKFDTRSEIEDWFMTLADARNTIIHEGKATLTEYGPPPERPLSRYAGPLFWIGERVLREAAKATFGPEILLCGRLKELAAFEPLYEALRAQALEGPPPAATTPQVTEPARPLDHLLHELGCQGANQVTLRRAAGTASASLDAAEEMARAARGSWVARASGRSMLINASERELLEGAGALLATNAGSGGPSGLTRVCGPWRFARVSSLPRSPESLQVPRHDPRPRRLRRQRSAGWAPGLCPPVPVRACRRAKEVFPRRAGGGRPRRR